MWRPRGGSGAGGAARCVQLALRPGQITTGAYPMDTWTKQDGVARATGARRRAAGSPCSQVTRVLLQVGGIVEVCRMEEQLVATTAGPGTAPSGIRLTRSPVRLRWTRAAPALC